MQTIQQVPQQRASFDSSLLSKRTSFELTPEVVESNKRRSLEAPTRVMPMPAPAAGFCGMPNAMPGAMGPWGPFQMPPLMGAGMMGMPPMMGAGMMGMPFCFPPPFIPPFMMPAAMAMWQQAMHQAATAIPGAVPPGFACLPPSTCTVAPGYFASAPAVIAPSCDSGSGASSEMTLQAERSSSVVHPSTPELCDNDFATFIDSFLETPDVALPLSGSSLALSSSFGCDLNLLSGSLSDLSECCKPLDLKLTKDDSRLNLLDLDLDLDTASGDC